MRDNLTCGKTAKQRPNLYYSNTDPKTGITYECNPNRVWRFERGKMAELIAVGKILFPTNGSKRPAYKRHRSEMRSECKPYSSIIDTNLNSVATREVRKIFGSQVFDYPKSIDLIQQLLYQATDKSSLILDAFAGSGTTAHAVINLNRADGGNRKFIMIESQSYAETITAERVRRVDPTTEFGYYEIGARLFLDDDDLLNPDIPIEQLREYVYFSETHQPLPTVERKFLLGIHHGVAYYFLYDTARDLTLTSDFVFSTLDDGAASRIICAPATNCGELFLRRYRTTFRRIPSDIMKF